MSGRAALVLTALAVALTQPGSSRPEPPSLALPAAAAKTAREFLFAFSRNDREAIKGMLPKRLEKVYGPCPFAKMPELTNPRVDTRTGAISFKGPMADPGLPATGIILLRYVEEEGVRAWRVRQLYWYRRLPKGAEIPDRSPTAADRRQEPELQRAAAQFLQAWLAGDWERMDGLTFHWWQVPRRRPKWVTMTGAALRARPTTLEGLRVDFVAKLKIVSLLPKRVHGNLWLVEEDGVWRVRPLTFTFFF